MAVPGLAWSGLCFGARLLIRVDQSGVRSFCSRSRLRRFKPGRLGTSGSQLIFHFSFFAFLLHRFRRPSANFKEELWGMQANPSGRVIL